jgi:hypothetical protein
MEIIARSFAQLVPLNKKNETSHERCNGDCAEGLAAIDIQGNSGGGGIQASVGKAEVKGW